MEVFIMKKIVKIALVLSLAFGFLFMSESNEDQSKLLASDSVVTPAAADPGGGGAG
jgi:hypothetical protein